MISYYKEVVLAVIAAALVCAWPLAAQAHVCGDTIQGPLTVCDGGMVTEKLTEDVINCPETGLTVVNKADTGCHLVVDCDGHTVSGPLDYETKLNVPFRMTDSHNVTLQNCVIERGGRAAVMLGFTGNIRIKNSTIQDSNVGILLNGDDGVVIESNTLDSLMDVKMEAPASSVIVENNIIEHIELLADAVLNGRPIEEPSIVGGPWRGGNYWVGKDIPVADPERLFGEPVSFPAGEVLLAYDYYPLIKPAEPPPTLVGIATKMQQKMIAEFPTPTKKEEGWIETASALVQSAVTIADIESKPLLKAIDVVPVAAKADGQSNVLVKQTEKSEADPELIDDIMAVKIAFNEKKNDSLGVVQAQMGCDPGFIRCAGGQCVAAGPSLDFPSLEDYLAAVCPNAAACNPDEYFCDNYGAGSFCSPDSAGCFYCDPWERCATGHCVEYFPNTFPQDCAIADSTCVGADRFLCHDVKSENYCTATFEYCDAIACAPNCLCDADWMNCQGRCVVENIINEPICPTTYKCAVGEYECTDSFGQTFCASSGQCDPVVCSGGFFPYAGRCIPDLAFTNAPLVCAHGEYACTTGELLGPSGDWICDSTPIGQCYFSGVNCDSEWRSYKDRCIHESDIGSPPDVWQCSPGQYALDCAGTVYCYNQPPPSGC
jgi:hypothetical protein